jgi:hypothetical protein
MAYYSPFLLQTLKALNLAGFMLRCDFHAYAE